MSEIKKHMFSFGNKLPLPTFMNEQPLTTKDGKFDPKKISVTNEQFQNKLK